MNARDYESARGDEGASACVNVHVAALFNKDGSTRGVKRAVSVAGSGRNALQKLRSPPAGPHRSAPKANSRPSHRSLHRH